MAFRIASEMNGKTGKSLRIAIQIERFDPSRGGAESYTARLARGLRDLRRDVREVTVICAEARNVPGGVGIRLVPVPRGPKSIRMALYARNSARAAREGGYDIVHALGKSLGMNILNPHGGVEAVWLRQERRSHDGLLRQWFWAVRRYLTPRHHVVKAIIRRQYRDRGVLRYIALSAGIKEAMIRIHGMNPDRIVVVPNRVDPERFRPVRDAAEKAGLRERLGLPGGKVVLLFGANNFRLKGLGPLIRALGILRREGDPPFHLVVLGRGRPGRYLGMSKRAGVAGSIEFRGTVEGMDEWYRAADGYVQPTFYDACSLAIPEARASGLPVLASRHDGSAEAISEGLDGAVVEEPDDLPALAKKLEPFLDPAWRARVGARAREWVLSHPAPEPAARMLEIYREALADPGNV